MLRSFVAVALAAGLSGCVVDPGPAYYGYNPGYYYSPGYYQPGYYAPGYYAGPSVGIVGVFGGGRGGHHHGWHGRR